jgi:hypothetical protein
MFVFKKYDRQKPCVKFYDEISPISVNLRVEVGKFYVRFLKIFYSETTGKFTLAMYFLSWTRIMSVLIG